MKRPLLPLVLAAALGLAPLASAPALAKEQDLPRAAAPDEVAAMLAKPPAGLEIVDIRPQGEFADYALPGSMNIEASAVLGDESFLSAAGPLLLVDKDGTTAMALAGALAQKTARPVLVLRGGMAGWWEAREVGLAVKEVPLNQAAPSSAPAPAATPAASPAPAAPAKQAPPAQPAPPAPVPAPAPAAPGQPGDTPQPPASKSAGC
ncbi:rhodanese-like domain-containing protein [Fundidesulfovibrio agrisoli]|uniref:rhodanese-like domain-containing protein n=1 Tax=Fundidesulfovibrio agrisoli TaxID=2922717 RepID=UPI001FAC3F1B|nr:rhodanese-like domain-containing protein [Fundidesulfovibrio agrisoli]